MGSRGKNSALAGIAAGCILICMAIVGPSARESARGGAANPPSGWASTRSVDLEAPARRPAPPSATAETPAERPVQQKSR